MISARINVTKIDKARLYKGEKGTYLDILLIASPQNQYGNDYMIVQSVSKEEREKGIRGNILGNAKDLKPKEQGTTAPETTTTTVMKPPADATEDVPF